MGAPGFWDDPDAAAKTGAEHTRTQRKLDAFTKLQSDAEDLEGLVEIAEEDEELAAELEEAFASVETRLAALEEERLFSGKYDAGDALVTVNAGAGGTDAQDWAEMVLRMMMRWAERRGFKVELLEASRGGGGGHQVGHLPRVSGENAYGLYSAEKGVHRLVRLSPFDSANRRQTSFAGVEVAPVVEESGDVEIEDDDLQVDTYRASGAGGQHVNKTDSAVRITHRPTGDRRAVPERALAVGQPRDRDGDAALAAGRARGARAPGGDRARARRGAGRQLRLADPLLRAAPVHDGQGPPHRLRGRQRRARARRRPRRLRPRVARGQREGGAARPDGRSPTRTARRAGRRRARARPTSRARPTWRPSSPTRRAARPASTCPATRAARAPTPACAPRSAGRR